MQYCPKCRISIKGDKSGCPLCGGRLTGEPEPGGFPVLERGKLTHMSIVKAATFAGLSSLIIMMALEILYGFKLVWVPFAALGVVIAWGDLMVGVYYRNNLIKTFSIETYLVMLGCLLIDSLTGWHGWSVAFVLPIGFFLLVIVTVSIGKGANLRTEAGRICHLSVRRYRAFTAADHPGSGRNESRDSSGSPLHDNPVDHGLRRIDLPFP